jgi:hypothetical protein
MNNLSLAYSPLEQGLHDLYASHPAADFIDRLDQELASRIPSTRRVHQGLFPRIRPAFAAILVVVLAALFFVVTPQGRAIARQILGFFTTTTQKYFPPSFEPTRTPAPTHGIPAGLVPVPIPTAVNKSLCGETVSLVSSTFPCQLRNAQSEAGFELKTFSADRLKAQFEFLIVSPEARPVVQLVFRDGDALYVIGQGLGDFPSGCDSPWCTVPDDAVQEVRVGPHPGEYVAGNWVSSMNAGMWWYPDQPVHQLAWRESGRWFLIVAILPPQDGIMEKLIDLAENLVTISRGIEKLAGADTPTLEQQAGFNILEPTLVPKDFRIFGATLYQNDDALYAGYALDVTDMVTIEYVLFEKGTMAAELKFYEMPASIPADLLWKFDRKETTTVEEVRVGGMPGQFLANANGQALVWTRGDLKLMITFTWTVAYGGRLDSRQLTAIAESMR